MADQNDSQAGTNSLSSHGLRFGRDFAADLLRDFGTVQDQG
jgi:hypothetical protein